MELIYEIVELGKRKTRVIDTPYGPSPEMSLFKLHDKDVVVFMSRHSVGHAKPPHMINYQVNIWAIKEMGVESDNGHLLYAYSL